MAFQQNIPQATDNPSDSQSDLLGNFQALETWSDVNHVSLVTGGSDNGKHKFLQMPEQGSAPTTGANEGGLYCAEGATSAITELFFRRESNGTEIQLTGDLQAASSGFIQLGGQIYLADGS